MVERPEKTEILSTPPQVLRGHDGTECPYRWLSCERARSTRITAPDHQRQAFDQHARTRGADERVDLGHSRRQPKRQARDKGTERGQNCDDLLWLLGGLGEYLACLRRVPPPHQQSHKSLELDRDQPEHGYDH